MNNTSSPGNPLADTRANYTAAVLDGKAAGLIPTAVDIPPSLPDYTDLSPAAQSRMKAEPDLNASMNITQTALDQEIKDLAQGDAKAGAALRMMAVMATAFSDLDPAGAPSVFELVRRAGLAGKEIGTFYEMCDNHPVKALGVLYAKEHFGFGGDGQEVLIQDALARQGTPGAKRYPVNPLLNRVEQALFAKSVLGKVEEFSLGKPKAAYEAMLARRAEREAQKQRPPSRLSGTDTPKEAIEKLSDGNVEAAEILHHVSTLAPMVDRGNFTGAHAPLLALDSTGIYGREITNLYRACNDNPFSMIAVLRARQLGFVADEQVKAVAAAKPGEKVEKLDVNGLLFKVMEALPNFSYPAALVGGRKPGDAPPTASGASGNPIPSVPPKINSLQPPAPGHGKGGVSDS